MPIATHVQSRRKINGLIGIILSQSCQSCFFEVSLCLHGHTMSFVFCGGSTWTAATRWETKDSKSQGLYACQNQLQWVNRVICIPISCKKVYNMSPTPNAPMGATSGPDSDVLPTVPWCKNCSKWNSQVEGVPFEALLYYSDPKRVMKNRGLFRTLKTSCSTGSGCHVSEVHTCFNHLLLPDYTSKEDAFQAIPWIMVFHGFPHANLHGIFGAIFVGFMGWPADVLAQPLSWVEPIHDSRGWHRNSCCTFKFGGFHLRNSIDFKAGNIRQLLYKYQCRYK